MSHSILLIFTIPTLFSTLIHAHDIKHHKIPLQNRLKSIKFSLYAHETFNKTAYIIVKGVAGPKGITKISNPFGSLFAYNDPLTETPNPSSRVLGYAEGMAATSSFEGERTTCLTRVTLNLKGYKGDLLNVGTFHYNQVSELPFVGGTGDFRFTQGFMTVSEVDLSGPGTCYKINFSIYWPPYATVVN